MRSIPLQQFKKGYKRHAAALGYKQISARPWQISDVRVTQVYNMGKLGCSPRLLGQHSPSTA